MNKFTIAVLSTRNEFIYFMQLIKEYPINVEFVNVYEPHDCEGKQFNSQMALNSFYGMTEWTEILDAVKLHTVPYVQQPKVNRSSFSLTNLAIILATILFVVGVLLFVILNK